ncbi:bifunctional DNA-formamidopyrimidine glycosylase/DNA-(apurinic or apyrimidinic site) lyase [Ponticaulis sp.]|uniref:bifunctional DNA-formamidopyrimidine glycosylase/DNA-(apurinic or apyrimidinic site) lyase n=1 Tax=Ponticaulis sp. TaxID=2020902 RepID=UPI000B761367|nr:bifunctional DNA-formamidopyrimidine glycosylase/DNA-(apurinic or apyrimidinic site) lyase [Ponticaulis sp.]MAI89266.1 DNA-formamidopyrimidine glycosylase [Ponticaulis sp.]OUY01255.1 MAG: DNA-formamidopyrimidine glycosylase [Hyphomonadaceae bacterium TMED5]
MPELPEVETVRRGLQPHLEGARLTSVRLNRPDLRFPFPERMEERLTGARVVSLARRAKFLVADTDRDERLVMHLGMSGRFTIIDPAAADLPDAPGQFVHAQPTLPQHDHVEFETEHGVRIVFNDPRRFGYMQMFTAGEDPFYEIGPEPLSNAFSGESLYEALKGRRSPIKTALLDQHVVAGLGNIYVCEALFRSGVSPRRLALNLGKARCDRLANEVRNVLEDAIRAGGSTLKDYAHADGGLGYFQHSFGVYGREGEACTQCQMPVQRTVQSGRSTFFCSNCQR